MALPIYQSPFPGRFLQADGTMTSALPPPEVVADVPSLSEITDFIATYTGQQILDGEENWGDLGARGADLLGIGAEVRLGIELAGQVAAMASGYGAIVVMGIQLLKWMTSGGPGASAPDPLLAVLQRINERLNAVEDTTLGAWASLRGDSLVQLRATSGTAMLTAQEYMAAGRPTDTFNVTRMSIADERSRFAVKTFTDSFEDGFWMRPANPKLLAISPWGHWMDAPFLPDDRAPVTSFYTTWDYRWALPAAVYAISARVMVLAALSDQAFVPGSAGCREVRRYASFLQQVRMRIMGGFRTLDYVRPEFFNYYGTYGYAPVAVGDIYTGRGLAMRVYHNYWEPKRFQPNYPWPWSGIVNFPSPEQLQKNVKRMGGFWWEVLYATTGLPELERVEGILLGLCKPTLSSRVSPYLTSARRLLTDDDAAAAASARGLVGMTGTDDRSADAMRAFRVFKALRDDVAARDRVTRFVGELLDLPESQVRFEALDGIDDGQVRQDLEDLNAPPPWPADDPEPNG